MSLQASWNTALGAVAGALHFQDVRDRMSAAEERRIARQERTPVSGSNRPKTVEAEQAANERIAMDRQSTMDRIYQMTNEEAAERAQMHLEESDTAENNLNAVVSAMRSRSTRDKFRRRRELRKRREGGMSQNGTTETT